MILTCPACATSYFVPDNAIGASGRRVRCKSCGHDWRATSDDAPLDLADIAAATSPGLPQVETEIVEEEQVPPPLPQAFRARAEQKRRTQQAIRQGLTWGLTGILVLLGMLVAYLWRDSIVARVPKLASAYKVLGISTNPFGLEFEAVSTGFARNDVSQVYVSGALRNIRAREIVPPSIRVGILDARGAEIRHQIINLDTAPVLPGGVQGFAVVLPNTDGRFAGAVLTFVQPTEAKSAPSAAKPTAAATAVTTEASSTQPQAQTQTPAKPAAAPPAASPAATAPSQKASDDDGLRRISQLTPSPNGRSDLDIEQPVGVSAGHG